MENHHAFLMGKLTISMAMFNSKLLVYQRVDVPSKSKGLASPSEHFQGV